jgi:hypothetical protein
MWNETQTFPDAAPHRRHLFQTRYRLEHCDPQARTGRGDENIQGYGAGRAVAYEIFIFRAGRASDRQTNERAVAAPVPYTLDHEGNTTTTA